MKFFYSLVWASALLPMLVFPEITFGDLKAPRLTLGAAVQRTLLQNKQLEAFSWNARASDGRVLQAGTLPNPTLSVSPENFIGDKFFREQFQNTVEISQLIELGGKRSKRVEVEKIEKEKSLSEYEIKRNEVLAELNLRFIHVLSDQEKQQLMQRSTRLANQMLEIVRARNRAGSGAGYEEPRTRVLVARAQIDEEHSEHELLSSRKLLASSWNAEFLDEELDGALLNTRELPSLEELYQRLDSSPSMLQSKVEERLQRAIGSLEEAKRAPDLTVGVGWRHGRSFEEQAAVASITIPLKIFDQNQGSIAEANALTSRKQVENQALPVRMKATVFEFFQELKHAKTELDLMKGEIIPQSERALALVQEGYKIGRYSFLELNEAQTAVIENHAAQIQAALTFHKLSIELNQLLGGPGYEPL